MHLLPFIFVLMIAGLQAKPQEAIARYGDLKHTSNFKHFDYADPNAIKGGTLSLGVVGTFDSTNPFITKGTPPVGLSMFTETIVFEQLMKRAADEPFSLYGLIAQSCEIAPDNSFIIFNINPKAKWSDGQPITVEDIAFTHETLKTKGRPNLRLFYGRVNRIEVLSATSIKFYLNPDQKGVYDPELPFLIALMSVIPKHIYQNRDFEKVSMENVVGSGPYIIDNVKPGHSISYIRNENYWGIKLPVNVGMHNFDRIKVSYYRESNAALMAFSKGDYDVKVESNPTAWHNDYNFKAATTGQVIKQVIPHAQAVGMSGYCFNQRRDLFKSRDVRRALALVFPFESLNGMLFYNMYKRNKSYYDNTDLQSQGLPSADELALLKSYDTQVPFELKQRAFDPTEGLDQKARLDKARQLLASQGWIIEQGKLVNGKTNQPLAFELLLYCKDDEKVALAYARELKKLGIKLSVRTLDTAQFENRRLKLDFDCILQTWGGTYSPGNEQNFYWNSAFAKIEGGRNYAGIARPIVDALCDKLMQAKDRSELTTVAHALDRVLLWDYMVVPLFYNPQKFVAYWDHLNHPPISSKGTLLFQSWWYTDRLHDNKKNNTHGRSNSDKT